MELLKNQFTTGLVLLAHPRNEHTPLLEIIARLASKGPVRVLDGGNKFNAFDVARSARRRTHDLFQVLERIRVARAFTCYQMFALLKESPITSFPTVLLNMLTTFYDENVDLKECQRLLDECIIPLRRLSKDGLVLISACPPRATQIERIVLLEVLEDAVDYHYTLEDTVPRLPPRLF